MNVLNFKYIFQNAFDTFKVFETIPIEISGILIDGHSKTIWETLNHIIKWREFQIQKLTNLNKKVDFNESESWIAEPKPKNQNEWNIKISVFNGQTERIENLIENIDSSDLQLEEKLKLIQDSSTHLSFHLGEIILIARQKNKYPKPNEMNEFLKE
jgi:exonuclease VII small subunit